MRRCKELYINPFWAGVGATIVTEVVVLVVAVCISIYKDNNKKK